MTLILIIREESYAEALPTINKYIKAFLAFLFVISLSKKIDKKKFFNIYCFFVWACLAAILFQSIEVYVLNKNMTILVPFSEYTTKDQTLLNSSMRPCAFFMEPQHFASFVMPYLLITLRRNKYIEAIVITVSILLSTSTQGLLCAALLWMIYIITYREIKVQVRLLLVFLAIVMIVVFIYSSYFAVAYNKLMNTNWKHNIRLTRAFDVFREMPLFDQMFGIGTRNINNYIRTTGVGKSWLMSDLSPAHNYVSTLGGNFVEYGFWGGMAYIFMLIFMFKKAGITGKWFVIIIFLSSLSQQIVLDVWFSFYWIIYYMINDEEKVRQELGGV